jgi:hypothetical protein
MSETVFFGGSWVSREFRAAMMMPKTAKLDIIRDGLEPVCYSDFGGCVSTRAWPRGLSNF